MTTTAIPTLKMVAAAAGVSKSTVSRVINDSPSVTPEAVAAVSAAIEELGYTPNRAARTLVSRRTQTLALVIPENTATFFTDPYFASVIQGAAMRVSETDFTLALLIAAGSEDKVRRYLRAGSVDGALVLSHHTDDRSYSHLAGTLPLVFGGRPMSAEGELPCFVDVDNVAAAAAVTRRLLGAGRRRIGAHRGPVRHGRRGRPARAAGAGPWPRPASPTTSSSRATSPRPAARPRPGACSSAVNPSTASSWPAPRWPPAR